MRNEIVEANPVQFVTVSAQKSRERVLSNDELKLVWQALTPPITIAGVAISPLVAYSALLAMVTLQRRGEITGMKLSEIDRAKRLWVIPSQRTKNGRTHVVPLSDLAIELIDATLLVRPAPQKGEDENDYVFKSPRIADHPIAPRAMTRAFARMRGALEMEDISAHDFRRTGATNLTSEALGFSRFAISKVLNHTSDTGNAATVTSVFDRNEYPSEKHRALDTWALRLLEIVEDRKQVDNAISIK